MYSHIVIPSHCQAIARETLSTSPSSLASTCNPPCKQLLTGLIEGAGLSVGDVGHWLWCCHHSPHPWSPIVHCSLFPVLRPCHLLFHIPVVHFLSVIALPSTLQAGACSGGIGWGVGVGCGVCCLGGHHYNMFRT
jgi:hypothetical protein